MAYWSKGQVKEVLAEAETTGPRSVGPYDLLVAAASRVRDANNRLVSLQAELHRAATEYDNARTALARMMADYGIKALVDGKEAGPEVDDGGK